VKSENWCSRVRYFGAERRYSSEALPRDRERDVFNC